MTGREGQYHQGMLAGVLVFLNQQKKQNKNTENHADWPAWEFLIVFSAAYLFLYEINLLILLLDIVVWGFRLDVLNIQSII